MSMGGDIYGVVLQERINDLNMSNGGRFLSTFMKVVLHGRINDLNM